METTFKVFTLLSPFIAAFLIYFLGIKSRRKDIDMEKEKELNTILSNLLGVWHYLTRIEIIVKIKSKKEQQTLFPKEYISGLVLNTGLLSDECFNSLDKSIPFLKKYDPITHHKIEGAGKSIDLLRKQYIIPFLTNSKLKDEIIIGNIRPILKEIIDSIEEYMDIVSNQINKRTAKRISEIIKNYFDKEVDEILKELDDKYYEMMTELTSSEKEKISFAEFKTLANTDEFKEIQNFQMKVAIEGKISEALEIMTEKPNISIEKLLNEIEKK